MKNIEVDNQYVALQLINHLFEKGLINEATYKNVQKKYPSDNPHISHVA